MKKQYIGEEIREEMYTYHRRVIFETSSGNLKSRSREMQQRWFSN